VEREISAKKKKKPWILLVATIANASVCESESSEKVRRGQAPTGSGSKQQHSTAAGQRPNPSSSIRHFFPPGQPTNQLLQHSTERVLTSERARARLRERELHLLLRGCIYSERPGLSSPCSLAPS
jgi:hypothetical protein